MYTPSFAQHYVLHIDETNKTTKLTPAVIVSLHRSVLFYSSPQYSWWSCFQTNQNDIFPFSRCSANLRLHLALRHPHCLLTDSLFCQRTAQLEICLAYQCEKGDRVIMKRYNDNY